MRVELFVFDNQKASVFGGDIIIVEGGFICH